MVVLDELNPVLDLGLLPVDEVVSTLKQKPEEMEVIITGRGAPKEIIDLADLHSEMRSVRRAADPQNGQPPSAASRSTPATARASPPALWAGLCRPLGAALARISPTAS